VLAGARTDERESELLRLLFRSELLTFDTAADFEGASRIDRECCAVGVTPRGTIAAVAARTLSTLLTHDADLDRMARVAGIASDTPTQV
jgi:predicted nucleic acid-binding protein